MDRRAKRCAMTPLALLLASIALCTGYGRTMADPQAQTGTIRGHVVDAGTEEPLVGAVITLVGTPIGTWADSAGYYSLDDVEVGTYLLQCSRIGFETARIESVIIHENAIVEQNIELIPQPIPLSAITVTPGRFAIMGKDPDIRKALTRQEIQTMPQLGEDIYRAITRLPGISANDFSAKFTVRGGEHEEVLVLLDGLELYEPFRLKDIGGGALSIVDVEVIEGVDLLTGGFPAEYGDRMSGVFNIRSTTAEPGQRRHSVGISFMNARAMSEGAFERGSWLVSARRGYLDIIVRLMDEDEDISPTYYDILGKIEYQLHPRHKLSAHFLHAVDRFDLVEGDQDESDTGYDNTYGWLNLKSFLNPRLFAQTLLAVGRVGHNRWGLALMGDREREDFIVSDQREFDLYTLKQDWNWEFSDRHYLKWGMDLKRLSARYDYLSRQSRYFRVSPDSIEVRTDTTAVNMEPSGGQFGFYAADRFRITRSLTAEIGLRYDHTSYTRDQLLSPRLNLVYMLGKGTSVRGGWGRFYQSEGVHEVGVQDGEDTFFPAELAEHWVMGLEHHLSNDTHLRVEGYYKNISEQRPAYRNWRNQLEIFPELQYDHVQVSLGETVSKGIETYLKRDAGGRFTWWASYALAQVEDELSHFVSDGEMYLFDTRTPGPSDQRHTLYLDVNYRPSAKWHLNVAWQYHTGWPYTGRVLSTGTSPDGSTYYYTTAGEPYGRRYSAFHRADLRISRHFNISKGRVSAFLEIVNLYDHGNVRTYLYNLNCAMDDCRLVETPEYWFRLLPSIGVSWSWGT